MKRLIVTKMTDHVWCFDDAHSASGFLVVGSEKAMMIDTMNGEEDFVPAIKEITDLPVIVVNTHGHPDHLGGNKYFAEKCYMNPADLSVTKEFGGSEENFLPAKGGDVFDLGGLTVDVIDIPGHTPGGILLLLEEERILFTGDSINRHTWMQLDHSLKLSDFLENLKKVQYLKEKADYILHGHCCSLEPISLMDEHLEGVRQLVEQKGHEVTDADPEYKWFGGICKQHPFADQSVIVYTVDKLPE